MALNQYFCTCPDRLSEKFSGPQAAFGTFRCTQSAIGKPEQAY